MVGASKSLMALCAADIMSGTIVAIPRQMSLQDAAGVLSRASVTGAPVVDDTGCCIGVLSATDFMHAVESDRRPRHIPNGKSNAICHSWQIPETKPAPHGCAEEYMTKNPVLVTPATPIGELARIMMDAHIHRIIVVEKTGGRPIGIVSSTDILAALARVNQMPNAAEKA